jgi:hypothetical protein
LRELCFGMHKGNDQRDDNRHHAFFSFEASQLRARTTFCHTRWFKRTSHFSHLHWLLFRPPAPCTRQAQMPHSQLRR